MRGPDSPEATSNESIGNVMEGVDFVGIRANMEALIGPSTTWPLSTVTSRAGIWKMDSMRKRGIVGGDNFRASAMFVVMDYPYQIAAQSFPW